MEQLDIFDICANKHGGNAESEAANLDTAPRKGRHRAEILAYLSTQRERGANCWEIEMALQLSRQTVSARCSELKKENLIAPNGERRPTNTGSSAAVLVLVGHGDENRD